MTMARKSGGARSDQLDGAGQALTVRSAKLFVWLALLSLGLICLGVSGCDGRPRAGQVDDKRLAQSKAEPHVAEIDLRRGAPEQSRSAWLGNNRHSSYADLVMSLRSLPSEPAMRGVFVRLGMARLALARSEEIGRLLAMVRAKGKPVVCHADAYSNSTMLLVAQACDEIWLSEAGMVDTVGLAAQLIFGQALLAKLEVDVDFLQVGQYKGAKEPFTRNSSSPEARASLQDTLTAMRTAWIEGIEKGRGKKASALALEDGPHTAKKAKELGLVDKLGFEQDARAASFERSGVQRKLTHFGPQPGSASGFSELMRMLGGSGAAAIPHIAVVRATGAITMSGGGLFGDGDGITRSELGHTLRRLRKNPTTKAVVLRIDSPGGSALASDLLWREVKQLREAKPVVISVGGMAASGGYYIASAATKIVAAQTSIVGSIGVVAGKLSFARSLKQIGVNVETISAAQGDGNRATYDSALSAWDEATRSKVNQAIKATYELFIQRIATGRGLSAKEIQPAAEGRIMGGTDGRKRGLVDEIGGLTRAIELAVELAKLDPATPVRILRPPSPLLELLNAESPQERARADAAVRRQVARRTVDLLTSPLAPYRHEISGFAASIAPLLSGERLLTSLPYALAVR